jgi:hypothetical protein
MFCANEEIYQRTTQSSVSKFDATGTKSIESSIWPFRRA